MKLLTRNVSEGAIEVCSSLTRRVRILCKDWNETTCIHGCKILRSSGTRWGGGKYCTGFDERESMKSVRISRRTRVNLIALGLVLATVAVPTLGMMSLCRSQVLRESTSPDESYTARLVVQREPPYGMPIDTRVEITTPGGEVFSKYIWEHDVMDDIKDHSHQMKWVSENELLVADSEGNFDTSIKVNRDGLVAKPHPREIQPEELPGVKVREWNDSP